MTLPEFFEENPAVAVAFSGGTDSSFLLYAAAKHARRVRAYYVRTAFQPDFEWQDALKIAELLAVELVCIDLDILKETEVLENPKNRCYFCKRVIFSAISARARADGFPILIDGTNASDAEGDRPGMRALKELSVLSPLRECGLEKNRIRQLSREAGLFTWDKPAYACLATRIPTGEPITQTDLYRVEKMEQFLSSLGCRDLRVRVLGRFAKIQIPENQVGLLLENRLTVIREGKKYFDGVLLDLEVRDA